MNVLVKLFDEGVESRRFHTLSFFFFFALCAQVLEQAWPFFGMYMEKLLKENIQQAVRLSSPALKTFTFTKVHFGHIVSLHLSSVYMHLSPIMPWTLLKLFKSS